MLNFLKNKETLLKQKLVKLSQKERITSNTVIKSVAILTSEELLNKNNIEELVNSSFKPDLLKVFSFKKFDKRVKSLPINFTNKSINRKGEIVEEQFKEFLHTQFDLLICFFDENNLYLEYASALSKATYKVGLSKVNALFVDLEIKLDTNQIDEFLLELKKYLIILNKLPKEEILT